MGLALISFRIPLGICWSFSAPGACGRKASLFADAADRFGAGNRELCRADHQSVRSDRIDLQLAGSTGCNCFFPADAFPVPVSALASGARRAGYGAVLWLPVQCTHDAQSIYRYAVYFDYSPDSGLDSIFRPAHLAACLAVLVTSIVLLVLLWRRHRHTTVCATAAAPRTATTNTIPAARISARIRDDLPAHALFCQQAEGG